MSTEALDAWGWRIPFLLGFVVGIAGYILRRYVLETAAVEKRARPPIVETLHDHWRAVAGFAGLSVYSAVSFYIGFVYLVSWLQTADGIPPSRSLEINSLSMVILLPVVIAAGWLSDWIGRKPLMVLASIGGLVGAVPLFWLLNHPSALLAQIGQLGLVLLMGVLLRALARHSGGGWLVRSCPLCSRRVNCWVGAPSCHQRWYNLAVHCSGSLYRTRFLVVRPVGVTTGRGNNRALLPLEFGVSSSTMAAILPLTYRDPARFETIPSRPKPQA
jgi:MFS family permease